MPNVGQGVVHSSDGRNSTVVRRSWTRGGPVKLSFFPQDGNVVDARLAPPHQTRSVKLPEFIAVGPKPLTVDIVIFVLKTDGDSVVGETPQRLGKAVVELSFLFAGQELANLISAP